VSQVSVGVRLSGSVGRNGTNRHDDVLLVQNLINSRVFIPLRLLKTDGICGPATIQAIESIQRNWMGVRNPSGRVDPDGATFQFLTGTAQPAPLTRVGVFPQGIVKAAQASQKNWGIPASVSLAQWCLESNWGKAMPPGSNNPFGIKATPGDAYVEAVTHEVVKGIRIKVVAKFKKFASINEAFDQHGRLLATARAYEKARASEGNPDAFADALTGVYATDPNYGTSLKRIMKTYNLYEYDLVSAATSSGAVTP